MAPFAERDGDIANAWMEGLGNVVVPREPLLPLSHSVNSKLTTLCPRLDAWLRGGVPTRSVTEIAGEAGSAKTQLALQLLIAAQLPREMGGLDGTAVYVHTEGRAPLSRLKQLVASHPAVCKYTEAKKKTKPDSEIDLMNGVYVAETLDDPDGLWTALVSVASVLSETNDDGRKKKKPVRLLVVDSVSSPFRESDASRASGAFSRARVLGRVAALLREYAHRHDVAVVVTNHVVDAFGSEGSENANAEYNADLKRLKDHSKKKNVFGPAGAIEACAEMAAHTPRCERTSALQPSEPGWWPPSVHESRRVCGAWRSHARRWMRRQISGGRPSKRHAVDAGLLMEKR